jgi:hypothetical protein
MATSLERGLRTSIPRRPARAGGLLVPARSALIVQSGRAFWSSVTPASVTLTLHQSPGRNNVPRPGSDAVVRSGLLGRLQHRQREHPQVCLRGNVLAWSWKGNHDAACLEMSGRPLSLLYASRKRLAHVKWWVGSKIVLFDFFKAPLWRQQGNEPSEQLGHVLQQSRAGVRRARAAFITTFGLPVEERLNRK